MLCPVQYADEISVEKEEQAFLLIGGTQERAFCVFARQDNIASQLNCPKHRFRFKLSK